MSGVAVAVVTEGQLDRLFYDRLFKEIVGHRPHITYGVRTAKEMPGGTGGKSAVLAYYDYLRIRARLSSVLAGKKSVVIFCLDKDLDDLTRQLRRSRHVVYTEYFDIESYLFLHGDIVGASSTSTTIDQATVAAALNPVSQWTRRVARAWHHWIAICVFEKARRCPTATGNYRVCPSPVHDPVTGALNQNDLTQRLTLLERNSGLTSAEFSKRWNRVLKDVDRYFKRDLGDCIFKGKWYGWLLERDLRAACVGRDADFQNFSGNVPRFLCQAVDFGAAWSAALRQRIEAVLDTELPASP